AHPHRPGGSGWSGRGGGPGLAGRCTAASESQCGAGGGHCRSSTRRDPGRGNRLCARGGEPPTHGARPCPRTRECATCGVPVPHNADRQRLGGGGAGDGLTTGLETLLRALADLPVVIGVLVAIPRPASTFHGC